MKVKRFFDKDIRRTLLQVREVLGPDAVIVSNQRINGGVEIVAATDYDESIMRGLETPAATPGTATSTIFSKTADFSRKTTVPGGLNKVADDSRRYPTSAGLNKIENVSTKNPFLQNTHFDASPKNEHKTRIKSDTNASKPKVVWSRDPAFVEMRQEIRSLKGIVQHQFSGLAWSELSRRHPMQVRVIKKLIELGLTPSLARDLATKVSEQGDANTIWRKTLGLLAQRIPVSSDHILANEGVVALVGPTGVGKTTTAAKLAARFVLRHGTGSVAFVTTDSYRIGAHEQLRIYGRILGVPVSVANDSDELHEILKSLKNKRLVLIDTAGMSQRDLRLSEQFSLLSSESPRIRNYLVLSATTHLFGLDETVRAFKGGSLAGCIITKVDEAANLGSALSVVIKHNLPVGYIGDGQRVPEDLHLARANNLVNASLKLIRESDYALSDELLALSSGELAANAHG